MTRLLQLRPGEFRSPVEPQGSLALAVWTPSAPSLLVRDGEMATSKIEDRRLPTGIRILRGKYQARWRNEHGQRHAKSFETLSDAELFLHQQAHRVRRRKRGLDELEPVSQTFAEVWDYCLKVVAAEKRSWATDESLFVFISSRPLVAGTSMRSRRTILSYSNEDSAD